MKSPVIEPSPAGGAPREPEAVRRQRELFHRTLREYLGASATHDWGAVQRARGRYLDEYLELTFLLHGGKRCSRCGVTVRHPKSVTAFHADGGFADYDCLCVRCLVAEAAVSRHVVQRVGPILYEHHSPVPCRVSWRNRQVA